MGRITQTRRTLDAARTRRILAAGIGLLGSATAVWAQVPLVNEASFDLPEETARRLGRFVATDGVVAISAHNVVQDGIPINSQVVVYRRDDDGGWTHEDDLLSLDYDNAHDFAAGSNHPFDVDGDTIVVVHGIKARTSSLRRARRTSSNSAAMAGARRRS